LLSRLVLLPRRRIWRRSFKNGIAEDIDLLRDVQDEARKLVSDPDLLKRILSNLVSNAVQAMPMGGKLLIHAFKDADACVITVEDTGVGIPEEVGLSCLRRCLPRNPRVRALALSCH
jgi:signal transduction histidine kinase